jgi:hypothetical protein
MIEIMGARRRLLVAMAVGALTATGCAGPSVLPGHESAFERSVKVIKAWSTALRTGHVRAAAQYFEIPSVFVNGPQDSFLLHSREAAVIVNRLLPCGAKFVSAKQQGQFVNALFTLTDRPGPGGGPQGCGSGAGTTARVDFIIGDGKITHWLRAPSEPGDNRTKPPATGTATAPGTATSPGTNTVPPGTRTAPPGTSTVPTPTVPGVPTPTSPGPGTSTGTEPAV